MAKMTIHFGEISGNPDGIQITNDSTGDVVLSIENAFWDGEQPQGDVVKPIVYTAIAMLIGNLVDAHHIDEVLEFSRFVREDSSETCDTAFFERNFGLLPSLFRSDRDGFLHFAECKIRVTATKEEVAVDYHPRNGELVTYLMSADDWENVAHVVGNDEDAFFKYLMGEDGILFDPTFEDLIPRLVIMAQYADKAYRPEKAESSDDSKSIDSKAPSKEELCIVVGLQDNGALQRFSHSDLDKAVRCFLHIAKSTTECVYITSANARDSRIIGNYRLLGVANVDSMKKDALAKRLNLSELFFEPLCPKWNGHEDPDKVVKATHLTILGTTWL